MSRSRACTVHPDVTIRIRPKSERSPTKGARDCPLLAIDWTSGNHLCAHDVNDSFVHDYNAPPCGDRGGTGG